MKKILGIILLGIISISSYAQKVGYFNSNEVLKNNVDFKRIDTSLNIYLETLKAGFTYLQDEYNEKTIKLKDTSKLLSAAKKELLNEDVASLGQKISSYQTDATQKLTDKRNQLLLPIAKKINDIVSAYAKENKYDIIFDVASTPIFYGNKANDLTEIIRGKIK